jgi:hypothetical protein
VTTTSEFVIHLLIRHSWFDLGQAQCFINLQDTIHAFPDIDNETSGLDRAFEAQSPVLAGADAIEWKPIPIGKADNNLHLGSRGGVDNPRRSAISTGKKIATVPGDGVVRDVDRRITKSLAKRFEKVRSNSIHEKLSNVRI